MNAMRSLWRITCHQPTQQPTQPSAFSCQDTIEEIKNAVDLMLLTQPDIQRVLEQVKTAFPNLTDWEYNNEKNQEYFGFSVWGKFVINSEERVMPREFFITLDINHEDKWEGCLTIGQPSTARHK